MTYRTDGPPGVSPAPLYNPGAEWMEAPRTFNQIKAGNFKATGYTNLWVPAAGKKFRLMGFRCHIPSNTTFTHPIYIHLRDNTSVVVTLATLGTTIPEALDYTIYLPGNGYLSAAANRILKVYMSYSASAGFVEVMAWGCEE